MGLAKPKVSDLEVEVRAGLAEEKEEELMQ
jgi:hypothetical protein